MILDPVVQNWISINNELYSYYHYYVSTCIIWDCPFISLLTESISISAKRNRTTGTKERLEKIISSKGVDKNYKHI